MPRKVRSKFYASGGLGLILYMNQLLIFETPTHAPETPGAARRLFDASRDAAAPQARRSRQAARYQMMTRASGARYILSPDLTPNAP
jgi:hypothetical protein